MAAKARAVFDANVLVRALVDEADDAVAWLYDLEAGRVDVLAPDLIYAELANALTRYIRAGKLRLDAALAMLDTTTGSAIDTTDSRALSMPACALAIRHGITAYDAHYLALAEAEDAVLVTADRRLAEAASRSILLD